MMTETFLSYLWKFRLLDHNLVTSDNEKIIIIHPGELNSDAGPDFHNARIRIDTTLWAGNVEIHVNASDWNTHGHQHDERYQNIILHVVYNNDAKIRFPDNRTIPTLELKGRFQEDLFDNYRKYMNRRSWIPCERHFPLIDQSTITPWLSGFVNDRLNEKAASIERSLILQSLDWEQTIYQHLAINFGFHLNGHAFELLAKSLPVEFINRHRHNLFELEALLFGQAGFLNNRLDDEYHRKLRDTYVLFRKKYSLHPVDAHLWNFLRLRPPNFPTIRIAQLAYLLGRSESLFKLVIRSKSISQIIKNLEAGTSVYWHTHYTFSRSSPKSYKKLGKQSIQLIIINTVVPFNFVYGQINDNDKYLVKATQFLKDLPAENNHIIDKWKSLKAPIHSAFESQTFLHLKKSMCDKKKCLECKIGEQVLRDI